MKEKQTKKGSGSDTKHDLSQEGKPQVYPPNQVKEFLGKTSKIVNIVSAIFTLVAVIIAGIALNKSRESLDLTKKGLDLAEKSFELSRQGSQMTKEALDVTKKAFDFQVMRSKPKFEYRLSATIAENNPEENKFEAFVKLIEGVPVDDVNILIKAAVLGRKEERIVFNHPQKHMNVGDKLNFDNKNQDFFDRITRNLQAIHPAIFSERKLKSLKLYAQYCVKIGADTIPYDDDALLACSEINPDYRD